MFCMKCGQQLDDNQKFCHKCGNPVYNPAAFAAPEEEEDDDDEEEYDEDEDYDDDDYDEDDEEYEDDEDDSGSSFNWSGFISSAVKYAFIAFVIWGLVHFNPSEKDQRKKVRETLKEQVMRDPSKVFSAGYVMNHLKYTDLWVVSWTYVKPDGRNTRGALGDNYVLCSVGVCGIVIPIIHIHK